MRCPIESGESADLLLAYAAGNLDDEKTVLFERHMRVCPACHQLAGRQRATWEALDVWQAQPVSAGFDRRLYQRIEADVSVWDRFLRPFRPLLVRQGLPIAAVACLLIVGVLLERPAGVPVAPVPVSAQMDLVAPEQADHALEDMELMREFNGLVHPDAAEPSKL